MVKGFYESREILTLFIAPRWFILTPIMVPGDFLASLFLGSISSRRKMERVRGDTIPAKVSQKHLIFKEKPGSEGN